MSDSAPRRKVIDVSPSEIVFNLSATEPLGSIIITNRLERPVAFKVKTTQPKRYLVRPNIDLVTGEKKEVKILLQSKYVREFLHQYKDSANQVEAIEDLFLVQATEVPPENEARVLSLDTPETSKQLYSELQSIFKSVPKSQITSKKLRCALQIPRAKSALVVGMGEKEGESEREKEGRGRGRGAAGLGSPQSQVSTISTRENDSGASTVEMVELRRKYNDLVNFTVQLTSERDRVLASMEDKSRECENLKSQLEKHAQRTSLSGGGTLTSFSLWQLLLVALMAFLVARLMN